MDGKPITDHGTNSTSDTYHNDEGFYCNLRYGKVVLEYEKPQFDDSEQSCKLLLSQAAPRMLSEGYITLQAESHPVEFRNIELMKLKLKDR